MYGGWNKNSHMRNARKVSRVMGCELRRQLSEPGVFWADSIRDGVRRCF